MRKNKIIYSINIEDIQNVALQEYERKLTDDELKIIADEIDDYFDWYEIIASAIDTHIKCEDNERICQGNQ